MDCHFDGQNVMRCLCVCVHCSLLWIFRPHNNAINFRVKSVISMWIITQLPRNRLRCVQIPSFTFTRRMGPWETYWRRWDRPIKSISASNVLNIMEFLKSPKLKQYISMLDYYGEVLRQKPIFAYLILSTWIIHDAFDPYCGRRTQLFSHVSWQIYGEPFWFVYYVCVWDVHRTYIVLIGTKSIN